MKAYDSLLILLYQSILQTLILDFKPPKHASVENQLEIQRTLKGNVQRRYKNDEFEQKMNPKVSLPSLPNVKKTDLQSDQKLLNLSKPHNRLPKLEAKSEVPKQLKLEDAIIHYNSVTPERRLQSPDRQLSLNKKRLLAKTWNGGQYACKTKAGCLANKTSKTNQDSGIVLPNCLENLGYSMFGVCDGHGSNGHLVSQFIRQALPKHLEILLSKEDNKNKVIQKAFEQTNKEIWDSETDTSLSGSTTVSVIMKKDQLWTANVGDSRAIICRNQDGNWKAIQITRDHKPNVEDEKQRILQAGGRVESQKDYYGNSVGPERVWLSYIDAPGLAMTRSLGDKIGAQAGVIADPEIFEFTLTQYDQCIIIASDGVWEYLSNEDVMNIVIPFIEKENIDLAADRLMAESINAWKRHSLGRDDITCIVVYLRS
ncbi:unnamed protein product [Paramecium octaurelia]|uniref:PPM-type phosphatase domain-containing protein n=1 Tax=Paramecium octaurelia TaxID=43137 RepID=A0A8S1SY34_PAROT|nr:unnamed protein product [Paramecium octaurelia]